MAPTDLIVEGHQETTRLDIHELARQLVGHLGPTLVAMLAGVRDSKLPHRWAKADGPTPGPEPYRRLLAAHRAWNLVSNADSDSVARAWFLGSNPRLEEESPIMVLREGRTGDVLHAAEAFIEGVDG